MDTMSHRLMVEEAMREEFGKDRPPHVVPVLNKNIPHYLNRLNDLGQVPISKNRPCPCGSGKKYKRCCMGKLRL